MNLLLDSTAIGWTILGLIVGIGVLIYWFRYRFAQLSQKDQNDLKETTISTRNKYTEVNAFKWTGTFLRIGLIMSLSFVVAAFNYTTFEESSQEQVTVFIDDSELEIVPRTPNPPKPTPPPPPPPVKPEIPDEPVEDTVVLLDQTLEIDEVIAPRLTKPKVTEIPKPVLPTPPDPVENNSPVLFAEQMPRFPGCQNFEGDKKAKDECAEKALLKFLRSKLRYPALAQENGISGTAVIRFIVEKDGSLSNISILKDPGGGLGKEAFRVIQLMNEMDEKWSPGKQNARPVRVQFNLPVQFRLN